MIEEEHLDRLDQRRRWLTERIKAKQAVGWEVIYDTSEKNALAWILTEYERLKAIENRDREAMDIIHEGAELVLTQLRPEKWAKSPPQE